MFRIGETDFGIDGARSSVSLRREERVVTIVAEIHGDEGEHRRVSDGESSPWFWTLYPPYFYLREFPVAAEGAARSPLGSRSSIWRSTMWPST